MSNRDIDILRGDFSNVVLEENQTQSDLFSEAFQKAIEALEKQTPKKPIWDSCNGEYHCSSCDVIMDVEYYNKLNFCGDCGQAIDWSEEVNKNEDY